jgi:hypothetical protein
MKALRSIGVEFSARDMASFAAVTAFGSVLLSWMGLIG